MTKLLQTNHRLRYWRKFSGPRRYLFIIQPWTDCRSSIRLDWTYRRQRNSPEMFSPAGNYQRGLARTVHHAFSFLGVQDFTQTSAAVLLSNRDHEPGYEIEKRNLSSITREDCR